VQHFADLVGIILNARLTYDAVEQLRQRPGRDDSLRGASRRRPLRGSRRRAGGGLSDRSVLQLSAREPAVEAVVKEAASHQVVDLVP
jgi:hypothetical protein